MPVSSSALKFLPSLLLTVCIQLALSGLLDAGEAVSGGTRVDTPPSTERTFGTGVLPGNIAIYDVDESGGLSEEELQVLRADSATRRELLRRQWDLNKDGVISDLERERARRRIQEEIEKRRSVRFSEADINKDDNLTFEEFLAISTVGELNLTDPERVLQLFENLDLNSDGLISLEEFLTRLSILPSGPVTPDDVIRAHPRSVNLTNESPADPVVDSK